MAVVPPIRTSESAQQYETRWLQLIWNVAGLADCGEDCRGFPRGCIRCERNLWLCYLPSSHRRAGFCTWMELSELSHLILSHPINIHATWDQMPTRTLISAVVLREGLSATKSCLFSTPPHHNVLCHDLPTDNNNIAPTSNARRQNSIPSHLY